MSPYRAREGDGGEEAAQEQMGVDEEMHPELCFRLGTESLDTAGKQVFISSDSTIPTIPLMF